MARREVKRAAQAIGAWQATGSCPTSGRHHKRALRGAGLLALEDSALRRQSRPRLPHQRILAGRSGSRLGQSSAAHADRGPRGVLAAGLALVRDKSAATRGSSRMSDRDRRDLRPGGLGLLSAVFGVPENSIPLVLGMLLLRRLPARVPLLAPPFCSARTARSLPLVGSWWRCSAAAATSSTFKTEAVVIASLAVLFAALARAHATGPFFVRTGDQTLS